MLKQLIREIEESFTTIPRNMPSLEEFKRIYSEIDTIASALQKRIRNEYDATTVSYLLMQRIRYALTLAHIPDSSQSESVLDVGGYGVFSYLLYKLRGYKNITCIDYFPGGPAQGERQLSILGDTLTIPYLNVNLDEPAGYPQSRPQFDKIFFFEVLEHLINPVEALAFLKNSLTENGRLFMSTPNCCSLLSFHKLLCLFVPMTYNEFNPRRWDTHFREWTPFALKYLLACAGMTEECFDVFYCFAEQASFPKEAFELYPFPGNIPLNAFLLGDDLFSISTPNSDTPIIRPPLFYNFGEFLTAYYDLYPERKNMAWFFNGLKQAQNN